MRGHTESTQEIKINEDSINSQGPGLQKKNSGLLLVLILVGILVIASIILFPIFLTKDKKKNKLIINPNDNYPTTIPTTTPTSTPITTRPITTEPSSNNVKNFTTNFEGTSVTYKTRNIITGDTTLDSGEFESSGSDENVFLITNGTLTLNPGVKITKTGSSRRLASISETGEIDDMYNYYGINSAIVVLGSGKAILNGVTITTNAYGSSGIVATDGGAIDIKNSVISTEGDFSRGIQATHSGVITAENDTIDTLGESSAAIETDKGNGNITASKMTLSTEGAGSPLVYSAGQIHMTESYGVSKSSRMVVIEGGNRVKLSHCEMSAAGLGNGNNTDNCGIMFYQSTSGDADTGKGTFEAEGSTLTILASSSVYSSAPLFLVTNGKANIKLNNISSSYGSGVILNSTLTDELGTNGSNGGTVDFTVTNSTVSGKLYADNSSSITFNHDSSVSDDDIITDGSVTVNIISDPTTYSAIINLTSIIYNTQYLILSDTTLDSGEYTSSGSDETVFFVANGTLTLNPGVKITKTGSSRRLENITETSGGPENITETSGGPEEGGGASNADNSSYGINSAIVVLGGGKAVINGVTITTNSYGSNAVVAIDGGIIDIKNSVISTEGDSSRGLHALFLGVITAENVTITTQGGSCANIAIDRGEGTINATKMTLSTAGAGSPLIYSTGSITVSDSTGSSAGTQIVVIEGKNSVILKNCQFTGVGSRKNVDKSAIMIYQSMSGDADIGTGTFEAHDSDLTILETSSPYSSAAMFFVTNIEAIITLENTRTSFGSNVFMNATATDEWGTSGSNGGTVDLTVTGKTISGKLYADSSSSITFKLDSSLSDADVTTEGDGNITVSTI